MQPHVVTKIDNTFGADQDGGLRVASSAMKRNIKCFVQPGRAQPIVETSESEGTRRVTVFVPTTIFFIDDADLTIYDQLVWTDAAGRCHTYLVVGYYPPCGTNVLWHAACEERT